MLFDYVHFPGEYIPTTFDCSVGYLETKGCTYSISLFDTASREDYDKMRPISYPHSRVCFVCYSVISPNSLQIATDLYVPELREHLPGVPIMLIGCKTDLRDDKETIGRLQTRNQKPITYQEGEAVAKLHKLHHMECSARLQIGLNEIFAKAVRLAEERNYNNRKSKCALL